MSDIAKRETALVNPETLLAQAIEKGLPVETMERLLDMRRELKAEWAREQYFAALAAFQAECPVIQKSKVVKDKSGKPRYHYAPLEIIVGQVKDLLNKHGFSYVLDPNQDEKSFTAVCVSHHVDGHSERTSFTVPIDSDSYMSAPQRVGSARTFAMRYAFCDAFGILTGDEDDDGSGGGNGEKTKIEPQAQPDPDAEFKKEDALFLRDLLLSYLEKVQDTVGEERAKKLRAAVTKNEATGQWKRFADWITGAHEALKAEVEKQEALLKANTTAPKVHPVMQNELNKALGSLAATVGARAGEKATAQGELIDHD